MLKHTPPTTNPTHGLVTGVWIVVVVVVDAVVVDVVVDDVVVDEVGAGAGGFVVVVVVVELVPPVTGRVVVDVVLDVLLAVVVVLDGLTGGGPLGSLDGTQRPTSGEKKSKNRRGTFAERAAKHTRSVAVALATAAVAVAVGGVEGAHRSHGSSTRSRRWSFTVTGTGGANRTELDDG